TAAGTRGATHQLHAYHQAARRLSHQLRAQGHAGMEKVHLIRVYSRRKRIGFVPDCTEKEPSLPNPGSRAGIGHGRRIGADELETAFLRNLRDFSLRFWSQESKPLDMLAGTELPPGVSFGFRAWILN